MWSSEKNSRQYRQSLNIGGVSVAATTTGWALGMDWWLGFIFLFPWNSILTIDDYYYAILHVKLLNSLLSSLASSSWLAPGTQEGLHGVLFGETPLALGHKCKWEDWVAMYYITGILAMLMLTVGLTAKPDTRIEMWAHKQLAANEETTT